MKNLAVEVTNIVNKYIDEHGMSTEMVCGILDVVSFRVKQASTLPETESGGGDKLVTHIGGGSPVDLEED